MHWAPVVQVPQKLAPPQRLFVSPHVAAPQPGFGGQDDG
jgi:hypothetical protein